MAHDRPSRLLTSQEVGALLGLSPRTLEGWRRRGHGPRFVRLSGRRLGYRQADVERWIDSQVRASTSAVRPPAEVA